MDLDSVESYSSQVFVFNAVGLIADARLCPVAWNQRTITYYYNDVTAKQGETTLPLF